jgi:hypothetical protein
METRQEALILKQAKSTLKITSEYLDVGSRARFFSTCRGVYKPPLLEAVFNANSSKVLECLASREAKGLVLKKWSIVEEYGAEIGMPEKKRKWSNINPIEAAALCGDNWLLLYLVILPYVTPDERNTVIGLIHHSEQELSCLKPYLNRIPKPIQLEIANQLSNMLDLDERSCSGAYLAPFEKLIDVYDEVYQNRDRINQSPEEKKNAFKAIGDVQKALPMLGKQLLCNAYLFRKDGVNVEMSNEGQGHCDNNINNFPPVRECLHISSDKHRGNPVDFSSVGNGYFIAMEARGAQKVSHLGGYLKMDRKRFQDFCQKRRAGLMNIINLFAPALESKTVFERAYDWCAGSASRRP